MIDLYLYGSCSSCRNAEAWLRDRGIEYRRRDFFRERFTRDELRAMLDRAGVTPAEVISTRSRVYRDRDLAGRSLSDDEIVGLMIEEPTLLRRPIAIGPGGTAIGFNRSSLETIVAASSPA